MRTGLNWVGILFACTILASCALPTKTEKLDANAQPIRDVTIHMAIGDLAVVPGITVEERKAYQEVFPRALKLRVPQIFELNGVPVSSINVYPRMEKVAFPISQITQTKTSHTLIVYLKSLSWTTDGGVRYGGTFFNGVCHADLWDVSSGRVVWRAEPLFTIELSRPQLRSKEFAAKLLEALSKDGFIALKHGSALDEKGKSIGYSPWGSEPM